jgi:uncharacterized protein (AIM24 family)
MQSNLFAANVEVEAGERMSLQNPRLLKVALDGEVLTRQGAMVAYQGQIEFAYEGAGGMRRVFKKAVTGEGVPLMRCRGKGDLFLAHSSYELHLIDLDGDSLTVNGANVLAFEPGLVWEIRKVEGATVLSGDVFNMVFTGTGRMALSAWGDPGRAGRLAGSDLRRPPVGHRVVVVAAHAPGPDRPGGCAGRARFGRGVPARLRG